MGISLYDSFAKAWENYDPGVNADPYIKEKALVNILIELRIQTQYLAAQNQNIVLDDPQTLRNDVVMEFPVTN